MIAVIGDLLLDVFLLPDLLEAEQTGGVALRPGGSAANTASWLAHQGLAVTFIGAVGTDDAGAMLERELQGHGVEARLRLVPGMETGAVVIRIRAGGERVMRSARGANSALGCADIAAPGSDRLEMVHLTGYSLLGEAGLDILRASGDLARRAGARLSFDPSSVGVVERFGGVELLELCGELGVDILLPNRLEASALTGERKLASAAARLLNQVPTAVIKDGARGSVYAIPGGMKRVPLEPSAPPVDTTGAGDAFDAGFLAGLLTGQDLEAACRTGHQLAQRVIRRLGGRPINVVSDPIAGERGR